MEFLEFPKLARLHRECLITEKIDGTNACVVVDEAGQVAAQSRNRLLIHESDPYGFALWVERHKDTLRDVLGSGHHFGEWWGSGIQRKYGLVDGHKRFSLFNVVRWAETSFSALGGVVATVPLLYRGPFTTDAAHAATAGLVEGGSRAAPGFMKPEGIVVFHIAGNVGFKATIERDEERKGQRP